MASRHAARASARGPHDPAWNALTLARAARGKLNEVLTREGAEAASLAT